MRYEFQLEYFYENVKLQMGESNPESLKSFIDMLLQRYRGTLYQDNSILSSGTNLYF